MTGSKEIVWRKDGHRVILLVDRAEVTISLEYCPNGSKPDTDCWNREAKGCVVKYFIDLYGLDINEGMAPAALFKEISWTYQEGLDLYTSEVKIVPVEDANFSAWVEEQMGEVEDGIE